MNGILRSIGIDVHKDTYSISVFNPASSQFESEVTIEAEDKFVLSYLRKLEAKSSMTKDDVIIGYEAGPTGFPLKRKLDKAGYRCIVMAPTTIFSEKGGKKIKTDRRDARDLARTLYWGAYKEVHPLSEEDESYRDYIRMRDDRNDALKRAKQNLLSFLLRKGLKFSGRYWSSVHMTWLKNVEFGQPIDKMIFTEYLNEVTRLMDSVELLDAQIKLFSEDEKFRDKAAKLKCFAGIDTHIAMTLITEIGDFNRFSTPSQLASFIGLCPGQHSSGGSVRMGGITRAGNSRCRKMLCESANAIKLSNPYSKSRRLKERQAGMAPDIIAYADRGSRRLKEKQNSYSMSGKNNNVAKAACARELACFVWGMMTGNIS